MVLDGMNAIVSLHMWEVEIIANILIIVIMTGQHHVMKQPFANMGQCFHKDLFTIPNPGWIWFPIYHVNSVEFVERRYKDFVVIVRMEHKVALLRPLMAALILMRTVDIFYDSRSFHLWLTLLVWQVSLTKSERNLYQQIKVFQWRCLWCHWELYELLWVRDQIEEIKWKMS